MMSKIASSGSNFAIYGRACRGEHYSGDLAFIKNSENKTFISIIDVAGHGRSAHLVALRLEKILKSEITDNLLGLMAELNEELKGQSSAVILAGILNDTTLDLSFVCFGDVHGRVFGDYSRSLVAQRGMLGLAYSTPIIRSEALAKGEILVLCTDGISDRYDIEEIGNHKTKPAESLARQIVDKFGKHHDDATCLVVRC